MMNPKVKRLKDRQVVLAGQLDRLLSEAQTQDRELTVEEQSTYAAGKKELADLAYQLRRQDEIAACHVTATPLEIDGPTGDLSYYDRLHTLAAPPTGMAFRNAASGETLRALRPGEPFCRQPPDDGEPHYLGRVITGWLTGKPDMVASAQQGNVGDAGGFLFEPAMSSLFVDLARSASVCVRAGAQTVPMPTAELHLARLNSDPTSYWRGEGVNVPASVAVFGRYILKARTLAAIVPITMELLEDAANAPSLIEDALAASLGLRLDQAALAGSGAESEPLGVRFTPKVGALTTVGTPTDYSGASNAVQQILSANYDGEISRLAWILHPRDGATFDKLLATLDGQPLEPTPWVRQLLRLYTTSISVVEGSGKDESYSIVGDFSQLLIGMRTSGVVLRRINAGAAIDGDGMTHLGPAQLKEFLVAYLRADVCVMRPTWFSLLSGITAANGET